MIVKENNKVTIEYHFYVIHRSSLKVSSQKGIGVLNNKEDVAKNKSHMQSHRDTEKFSVDYQTTVSLCQGYKYLNKNKLFERNRTRKCG